MSDILFKTDAYIFSYRVGGVLIYNRKVFMQNAEGDDGYAFIGGHVAFGETTDQTLAREFKEEIGADIKIERLLMVNENFFLWGNRPCQQINLYYLISLKDETQIPLDRNFKALDVLGNERIKLIMCWIPLEDIPNMNFYLPQARKYIINILDIVVYFTYKEKMNKNIITRNRNYTFFFMIILGIGDEAAFDLSLRFTHVFMAIGVFGFGWMFTKEKKNYDK